jgi:hypothetical protein
MDMSKPLSYLFQHRVRRKKGDTAQLAAQLAPLEEQNRLAKGSSESSQSPGNTSISQESGAIVIDSHGSNLSNIVEGQHGRRLLGMEPVVVAILCVMLAFIVFIAWQISLMPAE